MIHDPGKIVKAFCNKCDEAYKCWEIRRQLFDQNPDKEILRQSRHSSLFTLLLDITQDHWILQLKKLHDPEKYFGGYNLSMEYVIKNSGLCGPVLSQLISYKNAMESLSDIFKEPRNKILSHNDLDTIMNGKDLGTFNKGEDEIYFDALKKFVNLLHENVVGCPYPFYELMENDVAFFMHDFKRGLITDG